MTYYDEKAKRFRETLERFLRPGETPESIVYSTVYPESRCIHRWRRCVHKDLGLYGNNEHCKVESEYLRYTHELCACCGIEKYPVDRWGEIVTTILEARRDAAEALPA